MQMKNYVLRQAALLVAAVLLTTNFWSCSKDVVSVTGVTLNKTSTSIQVGGTDTLTATVHPYRYCPSRRRHQPKCNVEIG